MSDLFDMPSVDARQMKKVLSFSIPSSLAGRIADTRFPRHVVQSMINTYIKVFSVDMSDSARSVDQFESFGDFFARELKPGARPIDSNPRNLVSPADGLLHNCGRISDGLLEQVKGKTYSVAELLGDAGAAGAYEGGTFATIYLSPRDYHRVHSPLDASIAAATYLPGALYSVMPVFTRFLDNLFAANERIAIQLETPHGRVCLIMVAATVVGRVSLKFSSLATNGPVRVQKTDTFRPARSVSKGEELGAFHVGSTVVLLMQGDWKPVVAPGVPLRVGQALFSTVR